MNKLLSILFSIMLFCQVSYAVNTTVTMQAQWNALGTSIPAGDTVTVAVGANIMNTTVPGIALQGVLINNGTFSMNMSGAGIAAIGAIINYGIFNVNQGLDIIGMFINVGTLNVSGAAVVIQGGGRLYNTGTINNTVDIANRGTYGNCGTLIGTAVSSNGENGTVPNGTPCNDGDANTTNDVINATLAPCTCIGRAPIPTMSEWGLIILSISLTVVGLLAIKQWGFAKNTVA
ncbi:MAG: hypothetical protein IPL23_11090 [Saprospiraceae bacterium]|nr:hypothetical protein [Saprospiraceae bacterium]